jgi:hypothetical protein
MRLAGYRASKGNKGIRVDFRRENQDKTDHTRYIIISEEITIKVNLKE